MDTTGIEAQLMAEAEEQAILNLHTLGNWENFCGGAIRIACCITCKRHVRIEVFPNGNDEFKNQVYQTEIRGPAVTMECGGRKVN